MMSDMKLFGVHALACGWVLPPTPTLPRQGGGEDQIERTFRPLLAGGGEEYRIEGTNRPLPPGGGGLGWGGMRTLVLLYLFFTLGFNPCLAAPVITVDEKIHDFGTLYVEDQKTVDHRFTLSNAGDEPLVIRDIKTSCGCTQAAISRREIPPGESASLDASLQSRNRDGKERIRISVYSNDPAQPVLEFGMAGFLITHWEVEQGQENERMLLVIPATRTWDFKVTSYQKLTDVGEPWRILSAASSHPLVSVAQVGEGQSTEQNGFRKTIFAYRATIQPGSHTSNHEKAEINLTTSDPAYAHLTTRTAWIVEGDLTVRPRGVRLLHSKYFANGEDGPAKRSKPGNRIRISSRSKTPFQITDVKADLPFLVEWKAGVQSTSAELTLAVTGEHASKPAGLLKIFTNRPGEEVFEVTLLGEVQEQAPIFSSSQPSYNFGNIFADEAQVLTQVFELKNLGTRSLDLSVGELHGATPSLSTQSLTPGTQANLKVEGDLRNQTGPVDLWAQLRTNDPTNATPTFHLTGEILPRWRISPTQVDFRTVRPGEEEVRTIQVIQFFPSWASPVELIPSTSVSGETRAEVGHMAKVYLPVGYGTSETEVTIRLIPPAKPGRYQTQLPLQTKEPIQWTPPSIGLEWEALGDIRFRPSTLLLASPGEGPAKPVHLRIYSKEGQEFHVKALQAPEGIVVQEIASKVGETLYQVTATRAPLPGERLVFMLDREDLPEVSVDLQPATGASSQ